MTIATTTSTDLEQALIARIAAITPTHQVERDGGWVPAADNMLAGKAGLVTRAFEIRVAPGGTVEGGITGGGDTEKRLLVDVVTEYRGFAEQELGTVVEADTWDLYESLQDALDPGIAGLTHVEDPLEATPEADAEHRIAHHLSVFYLKDR